METYLPFFITTLVSLFAVIDPLGVVPIFILLTPGKTDRERNWIAFSDSGFQKI